MMNDFPDQIPIFPLTGVIYFPKTNLPLNIFEERYLNLVNDAMKKNKLMGMIQTTKKGMDVYKVGCLGKIDGFKKSNDGKIFINLTGLIRFEIVKEIDSAKLYREFEVSYSKFKIDLKEEEDVNSQIISEKIKILFKKNGLLINWKELEKLDKIQRINTLAMIAPLANEEKQKLLEAITLEDKIKTLNYIVNFYLHDVNFDNLTVQ